MDNFKALKKLIFAFNTFSDNVFFYLFILLVYHLFCFFLIGLSLMCTLFLVCLFCFLCGSCFFNLCVVCILLFQFLCCVCLAFLIVSFIFVCVLLLLSLCVCLLSYLCVSCLFGTCPRSLSAINGIVKLNSVSPKYLLITFSF